MDKIKKSLWALTLFMACNLIVSAQEINADYVYGCENCTITSFRVVGRHKVLFNYNNIDRRNLILLDTQNLVVDKIYVEAPMSLCPFSDNAILIPDLNFSAFLRIEKDRFSVEKLFQFKSDFQDKYGRYFLVPPGKGFWSITSTSCGSNKYIPQVSFLSTSQKNFTAFMVKSQYSFYTSQNKEVPVFSFKNLLGEGLVNDNLIRNLLVNKECEEEIRASPAAPGFHSYDIDGNSLMIFIKDFQKLFYFKMDSIPHAMGNIALPLPEPGGWRHFYDLNKHLSYFVFEKKEEPTANKKKKVEEKQYKLYRLDGKQLTKIADLNYLPVDIEANRLYELRSDKKAYHIYGHPLVPIKDDIQRIFIKPEGG